MRNLLASSLFIAFALSGADPKPISATYVTNGDIQAILKRMPVDSVTDRAIRTIDAGRLNVGVGVIHRSAKTIQSKSESSKVAEHDELTEVYYIIQGSGTLITEARLINPQRVPADTPAVKELAGPSLRADALLNGTSQRVGPGDVVIIPAGVGHQFSAIDAAIRYVVVRIDPAKALALK